MGQRPKINIFYSYNKNWIGGTYYIQNLISALNTLKDDLKPELLISTEKNEDFDNLKAITNYPNLKLFNNFRQLNILEIYMNKLSRRIIGANVIDSRIDNKVISFPGQVLFSKSFNKKSLFWIPDFQEKHLPHFFTETDLLDRKATHDLIIKYGKNIVFSSEDSKRDFEKFYPSNQLKQFVLKFAVSHSSVDHIDTGTILNKYNIKKPYFICCNQFWIHKNHKVVLEAIALLKEKNHLINVVFTGLPNDYRNNLFFKELLNLVNNLDIANQVNFLGFIEREEQLILLKNSISTIQPSLFEGWSTIIEDTKAQSGFIIASNLSVHEEQLKLYPNYELFDPMNAVELAEIITYTDFQKQNYPYEKDIVTYAENFLSIIEKIS